MSTRLTRVGSCSSAASLIPVPPTRKYAVLGSSASIPSWSARLLVMDGRNEEAFSEVQRAVDLDPFAAGWLLVIEFIFTLLQTVAHGSQDPE